MDTYLMNDRRTINAWALFDWANSAYALVISTAIFPIYFIEYTPDIISLGSFQFTNSALYSFAVSFSYIFIAALSPLLSGIADVGGKRKFFLSLFTLIGSIACMTLFFFKGEPQFWLGTTAFILATIGFAGSIVFYDSYLPLIVTEDRYNSVSARGYTLGYIGSVILLVFILIMGAQPHWFGLENSNLAYRLGFLLVGLWWVGFAQYTLRHLPNDSISKITSAMFRKGYSEIKKAYGIIQQKPDIKNFLTSFFFYSAGVQTVIYLATIFASKELGFAPTELIIIVLILQIVAIFGAHLFSYIGNVYGNKKSLLMMIAIWIFICFGAYYTNDKTTFYILAAMVGMVMGGIQSLSRATYSKLLPERNHDTTSYFSFYDVLYKTAIVGGTFLFGLVDYLTQNMRYSVLVLGLCFVIGFYFMMKVRLKTQHLL